MLKAIFNTVLCIKKSYSFKTENHGFIFISRGDSEFRRAEIQGKPVSYLATLKLG